MALPTRYTSGYALFRNRVACTCLATWLPVFEKYLRFRGIIGSTSTLRIWQLTGNYSASAGTHYYGGVFDLGYTDYRIVMAAREMGAPATWARFTWQNFPSDHIHGVLYGCPHTASSADRQLYLQRQNRDGTATNRVDPYPDPSAYRTWKQGISWANAKMGLGGSTGGTTSGGTTSGGTTSTTNFVPASATVKAMQTAVKGVVRDGLWGSQTELVLSRVRSTAIHRMDYFGKASLTVRKQIQGYLGANQTGSFDSNTKYRLKVVSIALQKAMGVPADGVWGPVTNKRFSYLRYKFRGLPYGPFPYPSGTNSMYGPSTAGKPWYSGRTAGTKLSLSSIRYVIKRIQKRVGATPYDGIYGTVTRSKVIAWQKAHRLTADGVVGPATWKAMGP